MNMMKMDMQDWRDAMVASFQRAVDRNVNLVVVVGDSTSTAKISPFQEAHPERVVNVGIAEQNLVGMAAGLALGGYVAVTANAAPFLVARSNEQIKNDVCYSNTNVKLIGLNAGVAYANLGSTHHAIDDISIMRGFGNIQIFAPCDSIEAAQIIDYAYDHEGPVYIRLDNAKFPVLHKPDYQFEPGKPDILRSGTDVTILALGSVVYEAFAAATALELDGISAGIVNLSSIRPLDREALSAIVGRTPRALTVEEHSVHGGIGSLTASVIAEDGLGVRLKRLGFPEGQFSKTGPRADIRRYYGIDADGIADSVRSMV